MTAHDAHGGVQVINLDSSPESLAPQRQPAPLAMAATRTPHPFFQKTSEKIAERRQARELEASRPVRDPTPASLSDHESAEYVPPKAKRQRKKTKTEPTSRPKRVRATNGGPTGVASANELPTSSPPNLFQSMKSDIDPVTAAAAPFSPVPSSPPPHSRDDVTPLTVDEPRVAPDLEIDPNQSTRKRRRTSQRTMVIFKVDTETGMLLRSSSPAERVKSGEGATKPGSAPETSQSPTLQETVDFDAKELKKRVHWRASCVHDSGRHLLILKSSPPPEGSPPVNDSETKIPVEEITKKPALRNAFALLGKKKPVEKPPPEVSADTDDEKPKKRMSARMKKKPLTDTTIPALVENEEKPEVKKIGLQSSSPARDPPSVNPESEPPKPAPPTPTHPFFSAAGRKKLAQSAPPPAPEALPEEIKELPVASNPGASEQKPRIVVPGISFRPTGFSKHIQKTPGMLEPVWPTKGTTHIRGLDSSDSVDHDCPFPRTKKLKSRQVTIARAENILTKICHDVNLHELEATVKRPDYRTYSYLNTPPEVRLPKRLVTTSSQLQDMVRPRAKTRLPHPKSLAHKIAADSDSESDMAMGAGQKVHPALMNLYIRLGRELTAFDTNTFDTLPWEVKYAPQRGCDVLQPSKEMEVLEAWLISLRTELFDIPDARKRNPKKPSKGAVKKKRKKGGDDLDGFVVTSEEEMNYMDELTDLGEEEGDWTITTARSKKSTIRFGDRDLFQELGNDAAETKKTNAVLISGPTGCGKSAAVYAVAKQLGYTVFEVSPGSRRNGKDLLDLVGDMSRNHLVHQAKAAAAEPTNPFSRARAATMGRESTPQSVTLEDTGGPQQSLILLEEVDILFEEDKTFWSSVVTLMAKSKRPIIMTCNDEEVIPLDTLSLHAILRFSRPPVDMMVDYLLLMAANEGHLLQPQCIRKLVQSNNHDLRSCIMELQFHCRIGVGDRTGSLNWQIIRFPHGCDVTESGEVTRVVSVDTYREGMGWVDFAPSMHEEDLWEHVWDQFGVDITVQDAGLESCFRAISDENVMGRKDALGLTAEFLEARSVADSASRGAMSASHQPQIDATHPERTSTTILDDPVGYPTLSTPFHPSTTDWAFTITAHYFAWSFLSAATKPYTPYPPTPNSTTILNTVTNRHLPPTLTITDEPLFSPINYQALFHPFALFHPKFAFTPQLVHSCVYPGTTALVEEAAPMIRGVLRFDIANERRRRKDGLVSTGGKRKTRAARMALEGKGRGGRGDRWFFGVGAEVLVTSGERWGEAVEWAMERKQDESGNGENRGSSEEMEV